MSRNGSEEIIWTSEMPDRRISDRRSIQDRRNISGHDRRMNVPNLRTGKDRRKGDRRKTVKLTITGRAVDVSEDKSRN